MKKEYDIEKLNLRKNPYVKKLIKENASKVYIRKTEKEVEGNK